MSVAPAGLTACDSSPGTALPRQQPRLQALVFDVDGTLADTEELHRQAFNEAFRVHGLGWSWSRVLYGELLHITGGKERLASYIERLQLAGSEASRLLGMVQKLHATKCGLYRDFVACGHVRPRAGVLRLMAEARAAGVRLAIASTTSPENVAALLASGFGPDALQRFCTIATGDVVGKKKPAPDIYNLALTALRLRPEEAIAFEDSAVGVQASRAAGVFTIAVPSSWTRGQDFAAADLTLDSLGDPEDPLSELDEWRIGAPYLGLAQLHTLHASAQPLEAD